jgi:hypothetical protein
MQSNKDQKSQYNKTLNTEELKELNHSFTQAGIKWIAMFKGIWAEVAEVKNGQVTILATFPKRSSDSPEPDLVLNIFLHCRAFNFINEVRQILLLMYKDQESAGSVHLENNLSEKEKQLIAEASATFGRSKVHIGERLYKRKELLKIYQEL